MSPEEQVKVLREALTRWLGTPDDQQAGWHGSGGTHEVFACEYCNRKHGDYTQIVHSESCPIPFARTALDATAVAARGPLSKRDVDALVYACRQAGDDSTYALTQAIEAAHGIGATPAPGTDGGEGSP